MTLQFSCAQLTNDESQNNLLQNGRYQLVEHSLLSFSKGVSDSAHTATKSWKKSRLETADALALVMVVNSRKFCNTVDSISGTKSSDSVHDFHTAEPYDYDIKVKWLLCVSIVVRVVVVIYVVIYCLLAVLSYFCRSQSIAVHCTFRLLSVEILLQCLHTHNTTHCAVINRYSLHSLQWLTWLEQCHVGFTASFTVTQSQLLPLTTRAWNA